jgi:hypothetical protein
MICGCLGEATYKTNDLSASVQDLSEPTRVDLGGDGGSVGDAGDGGPPLNCAQLNACEQACADSQCVQDCRARATASAVMKEMDLQSCFLMACPTNTDGSGGPCMDTASMDCKTCIMNSQVAPANSCTGAECHQCYTQASACVADQ